MASWRYMTGIYEKGREVTQPSLCPLHSERSALGFLPDFLRMEKVRLGEDLRWVSLERADGEAVNWNNLSDWQELDRLLAE